MKKFFQNPAMVIQMGKVVLLGLLLVAVFFAFPSANAKREAPPVPVNGPSLAQTAPPEPLPPAPKKEKKKKKAKKTTPAERKNYLTREEGRKLVHFSFETPTALRTAVDFWKMVYAKYGRAHEIFHDTEDLSIVYSIVDFSDLYQGQGWTDELRRSVRRQRIREEKARIREILLGLDQLQLAPRKLSAEEEKIAEFFKDDPNSEKYREAAKDGRLRSQTGIRDNFIEGIKASGAYLEEIEEIFAGHGLPAELTRMVFVESMFNLKARSKVGASGIWQFMPGTGRLYLNIDGVADERNDPIQASHAAARLLASNYEALGTWPLAINAYNSGRGTLKRAVASLGTTDIATIIQFYRGGVYGFASRNFYPCFLAALEIANQYPTYFGELKRRAPLQYEHYYLKTPQLFGELTLGAGADYSDLLFLNAHLQEDVLNDRKKIPAGYWIRVPAGQLANFAKAESALNPVETGGNSDGIERVAR